MRPTRIVQPINKYYLRTVEKLIVAGLVLVAILALWLIERMPYDPYLLAPTITVHEDSHGVAHCPAGYIEPSYAGDGDYVCRYDAKEMN